MRTIRNQAKTMKFALEGIIGQPICSEMDIMSWFARWAGVVWSRYHIGKDGRASYEIIRGRRCNINIVEFGEKDLV